MEGALFTLHAAQPKHKVENSTISARFVGPAVKGDIEVSCSSTSQVVQG